jgi:type II secretory pathway predicted ATPase ExeA
MTAGSLLRKPKSQPKRHLVRTPAFEEASARLQYLVDRGARLGLVIADSGNGKTTLLENFADDLRRAACLTAHVNVAALDPEELIWSIAAKLQTPVEHHWNLFQLWRGLNDRFAELRFLREQAVILVDDAGLASNDVLLHLYRLVQSEIAADARLSIVLSATPETAVRLGRRLLDLVELRIELPAWNAVETKALVDGLTAAADATEGRPVRFSNHAAERLHELAHGSPRAIARLAELACLAAQADGRDSVDAETVDGVHRELGVGVRAVSA